MTSKQRVEAILELAKALSREELDEVIKVLNVMWGRALSSSEAVTVPLRCLWRVGVSPSRSEG